MPIVLRQPLVTASLTLTLALTVGAQPPAAVAGAPVRAALVARLDSIATDFLKASPAPGMTIAVVSRGDTLLLKGYGERDREKHLAADVNTVYRIASITKQFTAAAVMRLVERGSVRLDAPITTYLPQYPQWSSVTVRQLLNHTSGIRSYTSTPEWRTRRAEDLTPAQLVAFVEKTPFDFPAGSQWSYNNTGYMLLGMLLERMTKQPYAALLQKEFFQPLRMRSAVYCPSRPTDAAYAVGYQEQAGGWRLADYLSMTHPYAAGALCMSVPDYLRWQSALHRGRIVSARSLALMAGPETLTVGEKKGTTTGYGMGLATGAVGSHATIQHGGSINGFSTQQYWFPRDSLSIVAFINSVGAEQDWLAGNLASAVLGLPVRPLRPPVQPLAAADRAKYEGDYDISLPDGRILPFRISAEGDELMGQAEGQNKAPLRYLGDHSFGADFDATVRLTFTVEGGRVVSGKLLQRGATMNVTRRP
ncbi:MAG TPA: serine hydrolase domain-containing protein [Gemmatimonadaceae bacterium]|nr:serine hydrolase domain-containing protein [Gemmatimonadaceae bacterium]